MSPLSKHLTIALIVGSSLIGCSKKEDYATEEAAVSADSASMESKAAPADAATQNPEQLLGTQQSALEQSRQLVKSSQLQFEVKEV